MSSTSFVSVYWSWNTHMCQVVCNPFTGMNFMKVHAFLLKEWFSSLNTNVLCVSWCQIERAARLRLWLGNLFHLHAIRDSKTWNDFDKFYNSLMTGKFFLFMASRFAWKTLISFNSAWFYVSFSSSENNTHAIRNDIVYIDHMKIADVPASPSSASTTAVVI